MNKSQISKMRNWSKLRIMGFAGFNLTVFTNKELIILRQMFDLRDELLDGWDNESKKLGFKVPKHRCRWCNKAATHQIVLDDSTMTSNDNWFCSKHKKEIEDDTTTNQMAQMG